MKNASQIHQNTAQEHSQNDLGKSLIPGPQKVSAPDTFFEPLGDIWPILGAFRGPAGRQGVPKIELFGTKSPNN